MLIAEITPKNVTQGDTITEYKAQHAIDMDLSTTSATRTNGDKGWLKLEFDKTYFIHKVVIYYMFYTDWYDSTTTAGCVESVDIFKSCADINNNVDVSVYQGEVKQKSCGTLQLNYGLEQSDQIYTLLCMTKGDTVKLSKSEGHIVVFELAVTSTCKFIIGFLIIR